jgi:hypothetical protein
MGGSGFGAGSRSVQLNTDPDSPKTYQERWYNSWVLNLDPVKSGHSGRPDPDLFPEISFLQKWWSSWTYGPSSSLINYNILTSSRMSCCNLIWLFILRNRAELQHQEYKRANHFHLVTWARLSQDRLTVTGGGRASEGGRDMVMDEGRGGGVAPWLEEEWRERSLT